MLPILPIRLRGIHARPTDVPESATSCTVHAALNVDTGTKKKCNNFSIFLKSLVSNQTYSPKWMSQAWHYLLSGHS